MRTELFEPSHNVSLFLHRLNTEKMLRNWNELHGYLGGQCKHG